MFNENVYTELANIKNGYTRKGNHYIYKLSEEDLISVGNNYKLYVDVTDEDEPELDQAFKDVLDHIIKDPDCNTEFNLIFSGKIMDSSRFTMNKWLNKTLCYTNDTKSQRLIKDKLNHAKNIVDNFFTVLTADGKENVKCRLKYTVLLNSDMQLENILISPEWYDPTFIFNGHDSFLAYKLFYNIFDQSNPMVEPKSVDLNIIDILRQIGFSEMEVEEISDSIYAIMQLSQFVVKGSKKSLEFAGMSHFKIAAKKLKVKEQGLQDFLIQEYTWKNNKKRLNSPENINRDVRSFICRLYEVIITIVFDKLNKVDENTDQYLNCYKMNFFHSVAMPQFNDSQLFAYGDYLQYSQCSHFHVALSTIIVSKVNTFANSVSKSIQIDNRHTNIKSITEIPNIITQYSCEKNKIEFLKKSEKNWGNKIRFSKEPGLFVQMFIDEYQIFAKFDWQSFIDNSQSYDIKHMKGFLKMSSISIYRKYRINNSIDFLGENGKLFEQFSLDIPMSTKTFTVHSLIDDNCQGKLMYLLRNQISNGYLDYLDIGDICSIPFTFKTFVSRYSVLFLNHGDTSKEFVDASKHAIYLLKLDEAWCSETYIHLQRRHIEYLEELKQKFVKSVIRVQSYARVIISKQKLHRLRNLALYYKGIFDGSVKILNDLSVDFETKYAEICRVDFEYTDLNLLNSIESSLKDIRDKQVRYFQWLTVFVMNKSNIIAKESFAQSKLCIFYSDAETQTHSNSFDLGNVLKTIFNKSELSPFIISISMISSGDINLKFKSKKEFFVWNVNSEINKRINYHLSQSSGKLYPEREYRLFSMDYILRKIAYSVMNRVPYTFKHIIQECSFAIIIEEDPIHTTSLNKAPLWIYFTNCYPICNLSTSLIYNKVEKEIRKIDKNECLKLVKNPSTRPKDDWLTEDVYSQLLLISLEKEMEDRGHDQTDGNHIGRVSDPRPSLESNYDKGWSKINYKQRKYKLKNFN